MSDTLRFTPLYVIRIFLDVLYCSNKNIIIQEALLEFDPSIEENLRQDLKKIDEIANSGDSEKIIKIVTDYFFLGNIFNVIRRYCKISLALFEYDEKYICDLDSFVKSMKFPYLVNHDVVKDLMPFNLRIMNGEYYWWSILGCIFRYILYIKTKHLKLFDKNELYLVPCPRYHSPVSMDPGFIFEY